MQLLTFGLEIDNFWDDNKVDFWGVLEAAFGRVV